jgi:hypothetical protein
LISVNNGWSMVAKIYNILYTDVKRLTFSGVPPEEEAA